jgi:phage protein D
MLMGDLRKPDFQIFDDGAKIPDEVAASVVSITIDERLDQAGVCTIELRDDQSRLSGDSHFKIGSELKVSLGYVGATKPLFDGEITGWKGAMPRLGPQRLTIVAHDKMHRMRRERKQKTFLSMKDSDIVSQVAQAHGFSVDAKPTAVKHDYVIQANQSDADFLLERAHACGSEMFIDGKKLTFRPPALDDAAVATFKRSESLKRFTVTISLAQQSPSVKITSWSVKDKKPVTVSAKKGDELSLMGSTKPGTDLATAITQDARQLFLPMLAAEEADSFAKARLTQAAMGLATGEGEVQGNPDVRRGSVIELDGIGDYLSGNYYVSAAIHTLLAGHGYTTVFRVKKTALQKPPAAPAKPAPAQQNPGPAAEPPAGKVEFIVTNQFGDPVEGLEYVLTCPDGEKKTGTIPANGVVSEPNAKPGMYRLALKGVDPPVIKQEEKKP